MDLQFPHHENEIAQSEGATGKPFVKYWMHNEFVRVQDEKMSKSLGNFFILRDVLKHYDPEVVRFFILRAHYRSPVNYTDANLEDAKASLTRLYTALRDQAAGNASVDWAEPHAARFKEAMDDDFGTPEAIAELFQLANRVFQGDASAARQLKALGGVLGLLQREPNDFLRATPAGVSEEWIAERIAARQAARKNKDFAAADRIRQELLEQGVVLEDKGGQRHGGASERRKGVRFRLGRRPTPMPRLIHPLVVRITHWINVLAVLIMITSGWQIYNASPLFGFSFPDDITLGGWLAGALQWHFAGLWLFALNGIVYLVYGIFSGHFRRKLLPVSPRAILRDVREALRGHLAHEDLSVYNAAQRAAYLALIFFLMMLIVTGLAIWKPVQLYWLASLMGDYEGARYLHFFSMSAVALIVVVHVVMVVLVPRTFPTMITGRTRS